MNDIPAEAELATARRAMSLGQLCDLALEDRCEILLRHDPKSFELVLRTLNEAGAAKNMNAERLAWAVAFNIGGVLVPGGNGEFRRGGSYRDNWPLDTTWSTVWSLLTKPSGQAGTQPHSTLLSELALSVACEQREDWQNPSARPVYAAVANQMFEFVYAKNKEKVLGFCRQHSNRGGESEAVANEAWARVFCDYWSTHASRRFLGLCRISTLVCQVARYILIDSLRNEARFVSSDENAIEEGYSFSVKIPRDKADPLTAIVENQLNSRIRECMSRLPAKGRIVAEMVWLRRINAKRVAQTLHVSEPAISQHLKRARDIVGLCLKEHGFNLPS